MAEFVH
jgi:hypothetical protein